MLTYNDAMGKIRRKEKPKCCILTGDPLLIKDLINALGANMPVDRLQGSRTDLATAIDTANQPSLLAAYRLLVIENAQFFSKKNYSTAEEKKMSAFLEEKGEAAAIIVFTADTVDKRLKPVKAVEKSGWLVDCPPPKGERLHKWLLTRLKNLGVNPHPLAIQELANRCGGDMMLLQRECEKLAVYLNPEEELTADIVSLITPPSAEANVFTFTDALGERKLSRAREEYQRLLRQGQAPVYILHMVGRHFRLLYHYSLYAQEGFADARIGSLLGTPPFVAKKLSTQSRKFTVAQLEEYLIKLARLDEQIKTGVVEPALGVGLFVSSIG